MILAVDTDALVAFSMVGAPHHRAVRSLFEARLRASETRLGVTPSVLFEFLHVTTDPRRFEKPMSVAEAHHYVRELWDREDVERILPGPSLVHRSLELMTRHRLGRKRILDRSFGYIGHLVA